MRPRTLPAGGVAKVGRADHRGEGVALADATAIGWRTTALVIAAPAVPLQQLQQREAGMPAAGLVEFALTRHPPSDARPAAYIPAARPCFHHQSRVHEQRRRLVAAGGPDPARVSATTHARSAARTCLVRSNLRSRSSSVDGVPLLSPRGDYAALRIVTRNGSLRAPPPSECTGTAPPGSCTPPADDRQPRPKRPTTLTVKPTTRSLIKISTYQTQADSISAS